jgi:hypothetical protein
LLSLTRLLLLTFALACAGVGAELLLLEHFEDWRQVIPLALLGFGIVAVAWHARARSKPSERVLRMALLLMAASGIVGQVLHIRGNIEFEREADPAIRTWPLIVESMMGATPALAPGTMVLLAVVGYAYLLSGRARG